MLLIPVVGLYASFRVADQRRIELNYTRNLDYLREGQAVLERGGEEQLREWLSDNAFFPGRRTMYIVDMYGTDILDRSLPQSVLRRIETARRMPVGNSPRGTLLLSAPGGREYFAVAGPQTLTMLSLFWESNAFWLIVPTALLLSALACLLLTRYFTARLRGIAAAAEAWSAGQLDVRVGATELDAIGCATLASNARRKASG